MYRARGLLLGGAVIPILVCVLWVTWKDISPRRVYVFDATSQRPIIGALVSRAILTGSPKQQPMEFAGRTDGRGGVTVELPRRESDYLLRVDAAGYRMIDQTPSFDLPADAEIVVLMERHVSSTSE